jgi:hypothetical protein
MRGPHDMGGLPAGPVDQETHQMTFWEKQIDALSQLLGHGDHPILHSGENRRSIEALGQDVYRKLSYYERWTAGITRLLMEKGIINQDEIDRKIAQLRAQYAEAGKVPLTSAKAKARKKATKAKAKSKSKAKAKAKPKKVAKPKRAAKAKKKAPARKAAKGRRR